MEIIGYKVVKDSGKPHYKALIMEFKADASELSVRKKIAKVLVDLVLFDFELDTLMKCVKHCYKKHHAKCSLLDALEARKIARGGVDEALDYLN